MNALAPNPTPICRLSMRNIVEIAAQYFEVSVVEILSPRREARVVLARSAAMYAIRKLLPRSFPEIGRAFGSRDHTTVMHACQSIEKRMAEFEEFASTMAEFMELCRAATPLGPPDTDPFEMAARVMKQPGLATNVSIVTIRDFAAIVSAAITEADANEGAHEELAAIRAAFEAVMPSLQRFIRAFASLEAASDRGEAHALASLRAASAALITEFQQHFNISNGETK